MRIIQDFFEFLGEVFCTTVIFLLVLFLCLTMCCDSMAMMCWSPIRVPNRGSRVEKFFDVPCGKCYACRMNQRVDWSIRLHQELMVSSSAYFVTFTYSDDTVPEKVDKETGEICKVLRKEDLQSFFKRLRHVSKFRYYAVGEYGEKSMRPHYHVLFFNLSREGAIAAGNEWNYGNVRFGRVEAASIHYCTKDMMKTLNQRTVCGVESFRLISSKPGIGYDFITKAVNDRAYWDNPTSDNFMIFLNGRKHRLPRYYQDRMYGVREIEVHAQEMEDYSKELAERYVNMCAKNGMNPFKYEVKEREALLRQEIKQQISRKL